MNDKDVGEDERHHGEAQSVIIHDYFEKDLPKIDLEANQLGKIQG